MSTVEVCICMINNVQCIIRFLFEKCCKYIHIYAWISIIIIYTRAIEDRMYIYIYVSYLATYVSPMYTKLRVPNTEEGEWSRVAVHAGPIGQALIRFIPVSLCRSFACFFHFQSVLISLSFCLSSLVPLSRAISLSAASPKGPTHSHRENFPPLYTA